MKKKDKVKRKKDMVNSKVCVQDMDAKNIDTNIYVRNVNIALVVLHWNS